MMERAGLQSTAPQPVRMNWDDIDDMLYKVAPEFKDPRFDSLRHVLNIISSVNAEARVDELRAQRERVEELVDDVVQTYHNGFNKAIHNYSQILHLFSESKEQVEKLRGSLEDARRRLGAQSRGLQQQWRRGVTLGDTVRLLGDINCVVDAPQKVQRLEEAKDWEAAVTVLLEACNKVARHELDRVGALRDIKRDMALRRNSLHKQLVHEIEERVFVSVSTPRPPPGASADTDDDDAFDAASTGSMSPSNSMLSLNGAREPGTPRGRDPLQRTWSGNNASLALSGVSSGLTERAASFRLGAAPVEAPKPPPQLPVSKLVDCLVKLGGIAEAQLTLRRHMPTQVRNVILRALQHSQLDKAAAAVNTHDAAAAAAQLAVERVFEQCLQMLRNLIEALKLLNTAKPSASSAGLELLLAARGSEDGSGAPQLPPPKLAVAHYVRREADAAWDCMQVECRRLLQELLHSPALGSASLSAAFKGSVDWLRAAHDGGGSMGAVSASGAQTFCFDVQVAGMAPQAVLDRMQSMAPLQPPPNLASHALGGQAGGTYLAPSLYRPVVQFVDGARTALEAANREDAAGGGGAAASAAATQKEPAQRTLRTFLETFISEEFLPEVYVNFRGRCTELLQHAEAFRARARTRAVYALVGEARPVLPAARTTEAMAEELLRWASMMPIFATHLTGVVENVLGQVLDAFSSRLTGLMGRAACRGLADSAPLAALMAREPAAPQAGEPVAFFVGKNGTSDGIDAWVATTRAAGFGAGGQAAELEVLGRIAQEQPIRADALLASTDKVASLAALADSADYLADVIGRSGAMDVSAGAPGGGGGSSSNGSAAAQGGGVGTSRGGGVKSGKDAKLGGMLTVGMAHLMDRYRALAGHALRALRCDLVLLVLHHLQELPIDCWACDQAEAGEVDECAGALIRAASRAEEDLASALPPRKRSYLFGPLGPAAARTIMWLLPELQEINQHGVARMCRLLAVLQPGLSSLGAAGGAFRPEAARAFEKARAYYGLLTLPPEALLKAAADRPDRFTAPEYLALLQANYPERAVTPEHVSQMARILGVKDPARLRTISIVKPFGGGASSKAAASSKGGR